MELLQEIALKTGQQVLNEKMECLKYPDYKEKNEKQNEEIPGKSTVSKTWGNNSG